ncbi:MAG TPA: hypothetical protein VE178_16280 [Silvibacterium sp.]|nr:hypothetical protein [Silvibacterium sp.]
MPASTMRRPAGVTLAAVVLALVIALGATFTALLVAVLFMKHSPIPHIPTVRIVAVCFDLLTVVMLLWSTWTVVGLFRLKPWARHSIMALGALNLCFFGIQSVGLLMLRSRHDLSMMMPTGPGGVSVSSILLGIAAFDAVLALIGLWWLVYFSLSHVRRAFEHHTPEV